MSINNFLFVVFLAFIHIDGNVAVITDRVTSLDNIIRTRLIPEYGVNFVHIGKIQPSVNSLDLLVAIPVPHMNVSDLNQLDYAKSFQYQCEIQPNNEFSRTLCRHLVPVITKFKTLELTLTNKILSILALDLPSKLPGYRWTGLPLEEHDRMVFEFMKTPSARWFLRQSMLYDLESNVTLNSKFKRSKRFVTQVISLISSGVTGYLNYKRQGRIQKGINMLRSQFGLLDKSVKIMQKDLLLLAKHSLEQFETIHYNIDRNTFAIRNLTNETLALTKAYKKKQIEQERNLYLATTVTAKYIPYLESLIDYLEQFEYNLNRFVQALHSIDNGRIDPTLIPAHVLDTYLGEVSTMLTRNYPNYELVFSNVDEYYTMHSANYYYDDLNQVIILAIPIYINNIKTRTMQLFHVESTYVPLKLNQSGVGPYTRLNIDDEIIAISQTSYLSMSKLQLDRCEDHFDYYLCRENTLVYHSHTKSCLASLYLGSKGNIKKLCNFTLYNQFDPPSQIFEDHKSVLFANVPRTKHFL